MGEERDHTFAEPTLEDFDAWLAWHLDKSVESARQKIGKVTSEHAARGISRSGITITRTFTVAHEEFDVGLDTALGELKRAIRITSLDKQRLREITTERLQSYAEAMKAATGADKMRTWAGNALTHIDDRLAVFDERLSFTLRQFDVGFLDAAEPEVPLSMLNSINVGHMSGGAVQQGTVQSSQSLSTINIQAAAAAVKEFEDELQKASLPSDVFGELKGDLDTVKAQLSKPAPSKAVLTEAGRSLRNVIEGATGGMLAPGALTAGAALLKALGLM